MKVLIVSGFMVVSSTLFAQHVTILIADSVTRRPVVFANIKAGHYNYYTDATGKFTLRSKVDTALITCMGYKPYHLAVNIASINDTVRVYLKEASILLKSVGVEVRRDVRKDSLRNRRLFSSVYNYKSAGIKEVFTQKASLAYTPNTYINAPNSTTSLAGINILSVLGLFNKSSNAKSKLKNELIIDEEVAYVNRNFDKQRIARLTQLKGDSLQRFIIKYRPTAAQLKSMTEYDLMIYIKKCYNQYIPEKK